MSDFLWITISKIKSIRLKISEIAKLNPLFTISHHCRTFKFRGFLEMSEK